MPRFCLWENERYEQRKIFITTDILSLKKNERTKKKRKLFYREIIIDNIHYYAESFHRGNVNIIEVSMYNIIMYNIFSPLQPLEVILESSNLNSKFFP